MERIDLLEKNVHALYDAKNPNRAEWADWLAKEHVFVVADNASDLAERFDANIEYSRAAALLHDIADAKMSRFDDQHEEESLTMSRELLSKCGFNKDEVALIVDDAILFHSCFDGMVPESIEGKVLATADSLAHLTTDFYEKATITMAKSKTPEEVRQWATKKIYRDYNDKIQFDEVRHEVEADYLRLKSIYS